MKKFATISLIVLFGFSCTKLDEEIYDRIPEDQFPENETQAALVVVPTYNELTDLIDDAGWWFWAQEVTSDEVVFPVRFTDWEDGGKWRVLHQHQWDNNTDAINSMWSHFNDGVVEANKALDSFAGAEEDPAALPTISKLKVLRALYYYLWMDNYGDIPYVTSSVNAPAQPFKADRAVIYENLVSDIENAIPYLPTVSNKFAVSKGMAYTLLAKLKLNAAVYTGTPDWEGALNYCDSVILSGVYFLESDPLGPFKVNNTSSPENIFTIPFDEVDVKGFRLHMRTLHYLHDRTYDMVVGPWNGFAAVEDHYDLYEDTDLRKEGFIVGLQQGSDGFSLFDETAGTALDIDPHIPALEMSWPTHTYEEIRMSGARVGKYEIETGAMENMNNDFPLFRYADVLLMRAEASMRMGGNGDQEINDVRTRAGVGSISGATLDDLLEERGREMFCEGHRRQDLIRFGKFGDGWWEKGASGPEREVFPIPQWAIDANPNLN